LLRQPGHADGGVDLYDVTVRYAGLVALEAISGRFEPGSLTAVVGANGAGKSTLLGAIAGVVRTAGGRISRPANDQIAYLPQLAAIDRDFPLTVTELIALGGWRHFGVFRAPPADSLEKMAAAVTAVGLTGALGRRIRQLSVGELRRALFARLIMQDAAVILLDEPFAAVDAAAMSALLDQVVRWHEEGRTVIAVLHDLEMVRMRFPSTLVLARRCVAWGPTEAALPAGA